MEIFKLHGMRNIYSVEYFIDWMLADCTLPANIFNFHRLGDTRSRHVNGFGNR